MSENLSINEQCTANDYRRVSRDAAVEAEGFDLLARTAAALTDPTLRTREDIFVRILEMRGEAPFTAWDHKSELAIEQSLGQAAVLAKSQSESAGRMAIDANVTADQVEQSGLSAQVQ